MKPNILLCAFACVKDPDTRFGFGQGGESGLGWNVAMQLSRWYNVFVLTDAGNKESIEKKIQESDMKHITFYYINIPSVLGFTKKIIQIYAYLWQIKAYFFAKQLHKKIHFDVFQHVTYANDWMASFIGALLPVPYVRGPGGGAHFVPKSFLKEFTFKERFKEWLRSFGQWIFRHDPFFIMGQNRAKIILICNQEAFDALPARWQKKAQFFPVNGISKNDLELFSHQDQKKSDEFFIFTAGKLLKIKAFDIAIEAFAKFSLQVPKAKLMIAGDGPELKKLQTLAEKLGISEKVMFEAWMPRQDVIKKMIFSDVFLFTSLRDGGGAVVVEAMSVSKPVVCLDIAGPGFHINDDTGIKIKPISKQQSIEDLAGALKKLYDNKPLRLQLGASAHQRVLDFYLWDVLGQKLHDMYQNLLNI